MMQNMTAESSLPAAVGRGESGAPAVTSADDRAARLTILGLHDRDDESATVMREQLIDCEFVGHRMHPIVGP